MALRADLLPALAAFEAAARHQNFAHAAEELHLTASAVSHHVRKLEQRLGMSLFQRHARGVALTPEGRQLADAAGAALADMDGVLSSLHSARDPSDQIRITTLHSLAYTWLMPHLARFSELHPGVQFHMETEAALTRFDDNGPDLGIRHGPGHWPGLTSHYLIDDALFPVASPSLRDRSDVNTPRDIACLPLISDHARQGWHDWFRAADVHGVKLDERHSFSDTTDALHAAAHGLGVALARARIAQHYLDNGTLVRLPGPALKARWAYYIVYPSHRPPRNCVRRLIDWLLAQPKNDLDLD